MNKATVDDFRQLQIDNYSIHAENIKDVLISNVNVSALDAREKRPWQLLKIGPTGMTRRKYPLLFLNGGTKGWQMVFGRMNFQIQKSYGYSFQG